MFRESAAVREIEREMSTILDGPQMKKLHDCLDRVMGGPHAEPPSSKALLADFLNAKAVEGCSARTIQYYSITLGHFVEFLTVPLHVVDTAEVRRYLVSRAESGSVSNVTLDNIRRIISSFFSWLEEEEVIYKSPVKRIKKIRSVMAIKPVISDEEMEVIRDSCGNLRDRAIIDLLASTGMRVGELVRLKRSDIDFESRECVVHGKGNKQRKVYFDAKTKIHLQAYLAGRSDSNLSLLVSLKAPFKPLNISGVESRLRDIGRVSAGLRLHPHKFRRTMATRAIDKGMPIEQVQVLLGHSKIDTTLCYAMVDQQNVKRSHHKYIS